jgi:hypothetical protein
MRMKRVLMSLPMAGMRLLVVGMESMHRLTQEVCGIGPMVNMMRAVKILQKKSSKRIFRVGAKPLLIISIIASKIGRYGTGGKIFTAGDDESYNSIGGGSSPNASYNDSYGGNTDRYPNQRQGNNQQQNFR